MHPGLEVQLDYAGPSEDHKGKRCKKRIDIQILVSKGYKFYGGKYSMKFWRSCIDT